jgi:hypothetical protein
MQSTHETSGEGWVSGTSGRHQPRKLEALSSNPSAAQKTPQKAPIQIPRESGVMRLDLRQKVGHRTTGTDKTGEVLVGGTDDTRSNGTF